MEEAERAWGALKLQGADLSSITERQFDDQLKANPFLTIGSLLRFTEQDGVVYEGAVRAFWTATHGNLEVLARRQDGSEFHLLFGQRLNGACLVERGNIVRGSAGTLELLAAP